jgi:hypothetical protein
MIGVKVVDMVKSNRCIFPNMARDATLREERQQWYKAKRENQKRRECKK